MTKYHTSVLLEESVAALVWNLEGVYADVTFGGGGHSRAILQRINSAGRLIAFDRDNDAVANVPDDTRFVLVHHNFSFLKQYLRFYNAFPVDGVLADLGISSHQIDEGERGFSHRFDGPLDMRMDQQAKLSASTVVNRYSEDALWRLFKMYGEISNARKLASQIIHFRNQKPIETTGLLKDAVLGCAPKNAQAKYLGQVYQAIRIEVNGEMKALEALLMHCAEAIKPGGKLVVISYHSLEDRLVKNFLQSGNFSGNKKTDLYGNVHRPFNAKPTKAIVPSQAEITLNKRARSAKMRIGIKL